MSSASGAFVVCVLFLSVFCQGKASPLGETHNVSVCYGSHSNTYLKLKCSHFPSALVVKQVEIRAKPESFGCPKEINGTTIFDESQCCFPNVTDKTVDCTNDYDESDYFRKTCNGKGECTERSKRGPLDCGITRYTYPDHSIFMVLYFHCVNELSIVEMCPDTQTSVTDKSVFIRSRRYTDTELRSFIPATDANCSCALNATSGNIVVYAIQVELETDEDGNCQQFVRFQSETVKKLISCSDASKYTITEVYRSTGSNVTVALENCLGVDGGKFWLVAFEEGGGDVTLTCSPQQTTDIPQFCRDVTTSPMTIVSKSLFDGLVNSSVTSVCSGETFKPDCGLTEVPLLEYVRVGAKKVTSGCPRVITKDNRNSTDLKQCCQSGTTDCIQDYSGTDIHMFCLGNTLCHAVNEQTTSCSPTYLPSTNYMTVKYGCVDGNSILDMTSSGSSYTGSYVTIKILEFIQDESYVIKKFDKTLSCSLETCEAPISVFSLHLNLQTADDLCKQHIVIRNETTDLFRLGCEDNFSLKTKHVFETTSQYFNVTLNNSLARSDGNFSLFFRLTDSSRRMKVSCPARSPQLPCNGATPPTWSTSTSSSSSTSSTPTTTPSLTSTTTASLRNDNNATEPGFQQPPLVIGTSAGVGILLIIVIVVCLRLHVRRVRRRSQQRTGGSGPSEGDGNDPTYSSIHPNDMDVPDSDDSPTLESVVQYDNIACRYIVQKPEYLDFGPNPPIGQISQGITNSLVVQHLDVQIAGSTGHSAGTLRSSGYLSVGEANRQRNGSSERCDSESQ